MKVREFMANPERWKRLSALFDELFELPVDQRPQWLDELRLREPDEAAHLEQLLDAHQRIDAEQFLELPPPAGEQPPIADAASLVGKVFGAYSLLRPLGQGGMGWVWLANRIDGRFEGQVAIKLLHPGLIRAADLERFRREGNLLARLSHPNIARLLDAGVANGQPYLVLEYVSGRRIDEACDLAHFDLPARVRLCIEALEAVSHAHARLVLHRDIKPSNVLVDDDGHVKLIDFGVARLVEAEDDSATSMDVTREFGQAFTPRFGAPEQWTGDAVGTTTDVYSMGLLLYVLLAGANPRDVVPNGGDARAVFPLASQLALQRGDGRQARALRGDLDNILAKAVKPEPAERYLTAGALADDLRRFLRGDPVTARPDSVGYRLRRFVGRHKLGVGGGIAALVAIGMLSAAAIWQGAEARTQRGVAVARGAAAYAIAQATTRIDRALLLGVEAVRMYQAPETMVGLFSAIDGARHLVGFRRELGAGVRLTVSADRRHVAAVDASGRVRHWSMPDWRLVAERQTGLRDAYGLLFAADATRLLVGAPAGGQLLQADTLQPLHPALDLVSPENAGESNLDIDASGTLVAAVEYQRGRSVHLYDVRQGRLQRTLQFTECAGILGTYFPPGGREIVLACLNGVFVHDLESGVLLRSRAGGPIAGVNSDPAGRYLVISPWDTKVVVVDARTLEPVMPTFPLPGGRVYASAFSANGELVALGTDTGWIAVWDIANQRELTRFGGLDEGVLSLEWLEDDFTRGADKMPVGRARVLAATLDGVTEWDVTQASAVGTATPLRLPVGPLIQTHDVDRGVYYVGRSRTAGYARIDAVSIADGAIRRTLDVDADAVRPLAVSPDGSRLLVAATVVRDGEESSTVVSVVDTKGGGRVASLELPGWFTFPKDLRDRAGALIAPGLNVKFSPDGSTIAAIRPPRLVLWSATTGAVLAATDPLPPLPHPTTTWAWAPDGRAIVTINGGIFRVHDGTTLAVTRLIEHTRTFSIKHSYPSAALGGVVFTSEGGEVAVFDAAQGRLVGEPFRAGGSQLQTSAVSPDGRYLAATSSDGAVRVWHVESRVPVAPPLRGHEPGRSYPHIWFSGPQTLTTLFGGRRIDWNLDTPLAADTACRRVGRPLTEFEWRQFVGDVPYVPACRPSAASDER